MIRVVVAAMWDAYRVRKGSKITGQGGWRCRLKICGYAQNGIGTVVIHSKLRRVRDPGVRRHAEQTMVSTSSKARREQGAVRSAQTDWDMLGHAGTKAKETACARGVRA